MTEKQCKMVYGGAFKEDDYFTRHYTLVVYNQKGELQDGFSFVGVEEKHSNNLGELENLKEYINGLLNEINDLNRQLNIYHNLQ